MKVQANNNRFSVGQKPVGQEQQITESRSEKTQETKQSAKSAKAQQAELHDQHSFNTSNAKAKSLQNAFRSGEAAPQGVNPMALRLGTASDNLSSDACFDAFDRSSYTEADAEAAVAKFSFLENTDEAMEYIGLKIKNGNESMLSDVGITKHDFDSHDCMAAFRASGYSEADATKAFNTFDFLYSVEDAKEYIGLKVVNGFEGMLNEEGISRSKFDHQDMRDAFDKSAYSDADATAALKTFDFLHTMTDAKEYIGLKIINNYEGMLSDIGVTQSDFDHHDMQTAFQKSSYSRADAKAAVKAFDFIDNVSQAKEYIGLKVMNGTESMLSDVGITPHDFDDHDCVDAFKRSGYSDSDARAAIVAFDFLHSVDDAKEYIGLKIVNNNEKMLADEGITPNSFDSHDLMAAFRGSGYTKQETKQVRDAFDFLHSTRDAKEYIGLKVVNGSESILESAGIQPQNHGSARADKFDSKMDSKSDSAPSSRGAQYNAYLNSDFAYNDAERLAKYWGVDVDSAKLSIGDLISSGKTYAVEDALYEAQPSKVMHDPKFGNKL